MDNKQMIGEYIKSENFRISFDLGPCIVDEKPLGQGPNGIVYSGRLNGFPLAFKFFHPRQTSSDADWKARLQKEFQRISLLENTDYFIQYVDFDILRAPYAEIPVLLMKRYENSLASRPLSRSASEFVELGRFLTGAVGYLHAHGLTGRAITPHNILIDNNGKFVLTDLVAADPEKGPTDDIRAIGEVWQWYLTGNPARFTPPSRFFKELAAYDAILARCLTADPDKQFSTVEEINAALQQPQAPTPHQLLETFSLICRKNFPKELPEFVHCADQKKISKLFADLVEKKEVFGNNLIYFTDAERKIFSPQISQDGFIKFDHSSEFHILDLWIHCDQTMKDDYILVHHAHPAPVRVNGKDTYKWAVYNQTTLITWTEAMNGFAEFEGDIIPLDPAKIEFFERKPEEGYLFICLSHYHHLPHPINQSTLKDYFFRFSFNYVNRLILEDMNHTTHRHIRALP